MIKLTKREIKDYLKKIDEKEGLPVEKQGLTDKDKIKKCIEKSKIIYVVGVEAEDCYFTNFFAFVLDGKRLKRILPEGAEYFDGWFFKIKESFGLLKIKKSICQWAGVKGKIEVEFLNWTYEGGG